MAKEDLYVTEDEEGQRLDKVLKGKVEGLVQSLIEKYLRKGDIRVNGAKVKSNLRVKVGDKIEISSFLRTLATAPRPQKAEKTLTAEEVAMIRSLVIHETTDFWALNKPAGLAVQGGSKTTQHVDRLLPGLAQKEGERPKLVHRLDKDTSGVLLIAKNTKAAQALGKQFASKSLEKTYWALVVGTPDVAEGRIDLPLAKLEDVGGEKVRVDYEGGQRAVTYYRIIEALGTKLSWLELLPSTGRTHQLRVHCAEGLQTPIVGDGKYGGSEAFPFGRVPMHLHARSITLEMPGKPPVTLTAELPPHMKKTWKDLGLEDVSREG